MILSMEIMLSHSFQNWRRNVLPKVPAYSVVTLTPDRPTILLLISLLRTLLPLFLLSQSLLGWTGRAKHLEVECFSAAYHSHHNGILSVLPGKPGCGETGRDDVSRAEEGGRAGRAQQQWFAVTSAVANMAAFYLIFCGQTAHFKVLPIT